MRAELAKAQAKTDAVELESKDQRKKAAEEAHRMAERLTATQAERDDARTEASKAREEAARLSGQLDTYKEQAAELLARLEPARTGKGK